MGGDDDDPFGFGIGGSSSGASSGDGWETVPPPPHPMPVAAADNGRGWEMVAAGSSAAFYDDDEFCVFPPSRHEGLHLHQESNPISSPPLPPRPDQEPAAQTSVEPSLPKRLFVKGEAEVSWRLGRFLESARCLIGAGMRIVHSRIQSSQWGVSGCSSCRCAGVAVWSMGALAGLVAALLLLRRRQRRERALLVFLIQDKDQKISQLLHQIAQMDQVTDTRHAISIIRRT